MKPEGSHMSEESERTLTLLQELAALKDISASGKRMTAEQRKRRKEIGDEIKQLANKKNQSD
jgi:hypothetical protein